jgi:hypothetical protein
MPESSLKFAQQLAEPLYPPDGAERSDKS